MDNKIKTNNKYCFIVGEPWDYTHPKYGDNQILGTVLEVNEEWVIFKCEEPVESNGISGNILILLPRHDEYKADNINSSFGAGLLHVNIKKNRNVETKYAFIGNLKECWGKNV